MEKLDGKSMDIVQENIKKLKEIFPEVFSEGKVDFTKLEEELGQFVDKNNERYNFTWNGKQEAKRIAQTSSTGTLRPYKEDSKNWDTTQNLYIEGDNLEVLKLLQKSYHKQVKMIYIDPPYNTGKDFVYKDNFKDNIKNYLEQTGQVDSEGNKLSTNSDTSGRYHSDWLSMMYPRLKLARSLLKDDGVIFISIDDNEVSNLRKLCDEIFGEDNFQGHIHWRRRHNQPNDKTKMIGLVAEHILCYSKNKTKYKESGVGKIELTGTFSNPDNDPKGDWASKPWKVGSDQSGSKYKIISPTGIEFDEEWMGEYDTYKKYIEEGRIYFTNNGNGIPRKKYYRFEREEEGQCATNWWMHDKFGHNQEANEETATLFGQKNIFSNPKPTVLLKNLISISNAKNNDLILDFFSGSSSTSDAIMQFNQINSQSIKFINVQLPENLDESLLGADSKTKKQIQDSISFLDSIQKPHLITEIGKERIRRAGEKIITDNPDKDLSELDIGFKVFKLDSSNIKEWDSDFDNLEANLLDSVDNIKADRSSEDLLYEILLKYGLDLTLPIEEIKLQGKTIYNIGFGALIVCLDDEITVEVVEAIAELIKEQVVYDEEKKKRHARVVFKDKSFANTNVKTNAIQVLKQYDIDEVVSI